MSRIVALLDRSLALARQLCWPVASAGLVLGGYLTLRPSSRLETVWWIPTDLARWCDVHGQLRNLPAFFLLAIPFLIALRRPGQRIAALAALSIAAAMIELVQTALPGRWAEWEDVVLSWAGLAAAALLSASARFFIQGLRTLSARLNPHREIPRYAGHSPASTLRREGIRASEH